MCLKIYVVRDQSPEKWHEETNPELSAIQSRKDMSRVGGGLSLVQIAAKLELKSCGVNGVHVKVFALGGKKNGRIKHFGPELPKVYERKN